MRNAFPNTQIIIVTNVLLLLTIKEKLIQAIKENHIHISISDYTHLDSEKIITFVQAHALSAELCEGKEFFSEYLNPQGVSDPNKIFQIKPQLSPTASYIPSISPPVSGSPLPPGPQA